VLWLIVPTLFVGVAAGCLGSLLGLGGGVFLVPFFVFALHLPFKTAAGLSLVTVIGTSVAVSMAQTGREVINVRLALVLQILTVLGATAGADLLRHQWVTQRMAERVFGVTAIFIAFAILQRLGRRNSMDASQVDTGALGGRYHEPLRGVEVAYRVRRLPLALTTSFAAGIVSSLTGVGGGVLVAPALNSWCGVPLRVAAATSTFIIGVTAVPGAIHQFPLDDSKAVALAAAAVLGVIAGARVGAWVGKWAPVVALKVLMSAVLLVVAVAFLWFR
jgi:hypothetical protein